MLRVAVTGKYPRLPAPAGQESPRDVARALHDGRISGEEADLLSAGVAGWIMAEQRAEGADEGADGLLQWDDPWTGFTKGGSADSSAGGASKSTAPRRSPASA